MTDDQTIPFYTARQAKDYTPYNYACGGYSLQQMLGRLQTGELHQEIPESRGIAVYTFIDHHVYRAIGSMWTLASWGVPMPYYVLENGRVVRKSNDAAASRPWLTWAYRIIGKSPMIRFFHIDLPPITENHLRFVAQTMRESHEAFKKMYPDSSFYILFYPGSKFAVRIIPYLKEWHVPYLDYSHLFDPNDPAFHLPWDTHPNAHANQVYGEQLAKDLCYHSGDHVQK